MISANIVVHPMGQNFCARDQYSHQVLAEGTATEAIARALVALPSTGGMVQLAAGDYRLSRPIVVGSRTTLRGSGRATRLIAPDRSDSETDAAIVMRDADGSTVCELTLVAENLASSVADGIVLDACGDCRVSNVFVKGFARHGVTLRNRSFLCRFEHCSVADCGRANYYFGQLAKDGRGGDYVPNLAIGCIAYAGEVGFQTENALVLNLVGCLVHQARSHGFFLLKHSNSVLLSGCRTYQVGGDAVHVHDSNELNVSSSIFCWTRGHGIVLRKVSWATICGVNVIDAGVRTRDGRLRNGIVLAEGTEGAQVTGNAIFSWGDQVPMAHGVLEDASCHNNAARGNNLNFFRETGFAMNGTGSVQSENLAVSDPAYRGNPNTACPDFTSASMDEFVRGQ